MIVAILGILKAGAAYVPLDPNDPAERLRLIARDAGITALITESGLARSWPCQDVPMVLMDEESCILDRLSNTELAPAGSPTSLAYVMYTSGSTGEPKGVLIEHRSVVRLITAAEYATFGPDRVFLQLAPLAFDASTFEIWGPCCMAPGWCWRPTGHPISPSWAADRGPGCDHGLAYSGTVQRNHRIAPGNARGGAEILTGGEALSPRHVLMAYRSAPGPCASSTATGPRRARRSPAATRSTRPGSRPRTTSRSAGRSAIPGPTCSTATGSRSRWAWRASCIWAATGWRGAT